MLSPLWQMIIAGGFRELVESGLGVAKQVRSVNKNRGMAGQLRNPKGVPGAGSEGAPSSEPGAAREGTLQKLNKIEVGKIINIMQSLQIELNSLGEMLEQVEATEKLIKDAMVRLGASPISENTVLRRLAGLSGEN